MTQTERYDRLYAWRRDIVRSEQARWRGHKTMGQYDKASAIVTCVLAFTGIHLAKWEREIETHAKVACCRAERWRKPLRYHHA